MLKWLAPTARSNWDEVSAKWSTLSQQIEGVKRTHQWIVEQIKFALFSYQRENPGSRWFGLSKKMGVRRSKGDEGGGAMGYFNLISKIWDYKINDQTKMHAESSISCGRSHFTTTSLSLSNGKLTRSRSVRQSNCLQIRQVPLYCVFGLHHKRSLLVDKKEVTRFCHLYNFQDYSNSQHLQLD